MENNVCRFVPRQPNYDQITVLHFVLETKNQPGTETHRQAHYAMYYMARGEGVLHTARETHPLQEGDLFMTLPAVPWSLETGEGAQYLYVSFIGGRASALVDRLGITPARCVWHGMNHLESLWRSGLEVGQEITGMRSEAILLYSLSEIGKLRFARETEESKTQGAAMAVRKYVDDHFADPGLTLEVAGRSCGYHPKYVSAVFSRAFHMRFSDYLNTIRIQHACVLMEQGIACIKDIAALCGYTDAMYFSRVFRKHMNISPKEHCAEIRAMMDAKR